MESSGKQHCLGRHHHVEERRNSSSGGTSNPQRAVTDDSKSLEKEHSGERTERMECGFTWPYFGHTQASQMMGLRAMKIMHWHPIFTGFGFQKIQYFEQKSKVGCEGGQETKLPRTLC